MSLEIEKRFKNFDYKTLRQLFEEVGVEKDGGQLFKISTFNPVKPNQIVRTRDEGEKITFTIKEHTNDYDKEWEVVIDNKEMIDLMLEELGIKKKNSMEKFRERYKYGDSEIIFDHNPGLKPYLEIESKNEEDLFDLMRKLNLADEPEKFTALDLFLSEYGIPKEPKRDNVTFENAHEVLLPLVTKNEDKFLAILNHQKQFLSKYKNKNNDMEIYKQTGGKIRFR